VVPAYLAVEKVLAQTLAAPADATVVAVVDVLVWVVVPELAYAAEVAGRGGAAVDAALGGLLGTGAEHAEHVLGVLADELVVLGGIVTEAACVPLGAC
jgi:hypothetical protein